MGYTSTKSLVRRVEALENKTRKPGPEKRNRLLEMSTTAMALAWTADEVEEMLAAAEQSRLDQLPPDLCRRWVRCLDRISLQYFGKTFDALLASPLVNSEPATSPTVCSRDIDPD